MFRKLVLATTTLALAVFVLSSSSVDAKPGPGCGARDNGCQASDITFTPNLNPTPPLPVCLQGVTYYNLNATISCGIQIGGGTSVSLLVCPASSQSASVNIGGQTHTFSPAAGLTWQDVINNCSGNISYSVN